MRKATRREASNYLAGLVGPKNHITLVYVDPETVDIWLETDHPIHPKIKPVLNKNGRGYAEKRS